MTHETRALIAHRIALQAVVVEVTANADGRPAKHYEGGPGGQHVDRMFEAALLAARNAVADVGEWELAAAAARDAVRSVFWSGP